MTRRRQTSPRSGALPKREPNGRHDRALDRLVEARSPTEVRRLRDAALAGLRAPEWGSELGRLLLQEKLSASQYEAGRRFAILAREYHAALGAPGFPTSSLGRNGSGRHTEGPTEALRHQEAIHHYDEAIAVLRASPPFLEPLVRLVCERDATVYGSLSLAHLKTALDALATHWRIPP